MTEGATPSSAEEQLAAIASLSSALDQHGVEYWLFFEALSRLEDEPFS
jgi:hypothetical protein